jgi:16S rRNA (guanine527-N7)-methyltransferase
VEIARIADLLAPFLAGGPSTPKQLEQISTYLDLLLRWNTRINLTAVRKPEAIVTRHFGESLFAAAYLLRPDQVLGAIDVGSGAGFPGLPLKLCAPRIRLTLIESQHKKATFVREVIRALTLTDVNVFSGRAEDYAAQIASGSASPPDLVTLRAVERFETTLPLAARLLEIPAPDSPPQPSALTPATTGFATPIGPLSPASPRPASFPATSAPSPVSDSPPLHRQGGAQPPDGPALLGSAPSFAEAPRPATRRLDNLLGRDQAARARQLLPRFSWAPPVPIPGSAARVLLVGTAQR